MIKIAFLYSKSIDSNNITGVDKKVIAQIKALNTIRSTCDLIQLNQIKNLFFLKASQILSLLPFFNIYPNWQYPKILNDYDYVYIRRPPFFSSSFIKLLRRIHSNGKKIILEIPNFPYEDELLIKLRYFPYFIKDKIWKKSLRNYVFRVAIQNKNYPEVFNIKTIQFVNPIDFNIFQIRELTIFSPIVKLCAVATLHPWQGYERLIRGLHNYYKKNGKMNFEIHIAGNGSELNFYKKLVKKFKLENNFFFVGFITGDKLDKFFDGCHIALDSFGRYKTRNFNSTSLKSREYVARGIPIISGSEIDFIENNTKWFYVFPNDSSDIDFFKIESFYNSLYGDQTSSTELSNEIRNYGFSKIDLSVAMIKFLDFLFNNG